MPLNKRKLFNARKESMDASSRGGVSSLSSAKEVKHGRERSNSSIGNLSARQSQDFSGIGKDILASEKSANIMKIL